MEAFQKCVQILFMTNEVNSIFSQIPNFATNFEEILSPALELSVLSLGKLLRGFWIDNYF